MTNNFTFNSKRVSTVGFGCGFRLPNEIKQWEDVALPIIQVALDLGLNFLDTAECYGSGNSEVTVARALASRDKDQQVVATKVSPENLSKTKLIQSCEQSLRRLNTSIIDLYQIHWSNPAIKIEETFDALSSLIDAGKVAEVGVCNFSLLELQKAEKVFSPYEISSVQLEYNLLDRSVELGLLPYCHRTGKKVIAYSPLNQGALNGSGDPYQRLAGIAAEYDADISCIVLNWIYSKGILPIPNSTKNERVKNFLKSLTLDVNQKHRNEIDNLFPFEPIEVNPRLIKVSPNGLWSPSVYRTLEEAKQNAAKITPSPQDLANQFLAGDFLKPARVRKIQNPQDQYMYELVEGRMRFWGWLIAYGESKSIPVLVRD
jgi:diketogulonate reductase-like aldo/keto reductase